MKRFALPAGPDMNHEIRLLIVEDNPADAELAEDTLRSAGVKFVSRIVETEGEYIDALDDFSPDIILSDYDLPLFTGALAQKIAQERCPDVPFILFTGAMGEERAIEILTGGATDYVMKNRLSRLVPAVARALKESEEHRKRKQAEEERDALFQELEMKVLERTAQLQDEIAERKRAEEELRQSEAKYRQLFVDTDREKNYIAAILQALPVGLAIVDTKGATVLSNAAFENVWGNPLPKTEDLSDYASYQAWWSDGTLVKPEEWASSLAVSKGEAVLGQQLEIQRFDGSRAFVLNSALPVHNSSGDITGAVVTIMDITQLRQAERLLLWNKDREELLADVAGRLLTSADPQKIANELFQQTMKFLECDVFFNYLVNENMGCLNLNAYSGIPEGEAKKIERLDYGVAVCGCAARDAARLIMEDIPATPDVRTELVKSYGVKAYACHPLVIEGKVLGTISFGTRSRAHFQQRELDVMKTIADFVAIAMHRLLSNKALKESEARYKSLFEIVSKPE